MLLPLVSRGGDYPRELSEFYMKFPYREPKDILDFVKDQAAPGDVDGTLRAMGVFAARYPMYALSSRKASVLSREVAALRSSTAVGSPSRILEIGSFLGYSAVNIARTMGQNDTLTMIEGSEQNALVARQVLQHAFGAGSQILERIRIIRALSREALKRPEVLCESSPLLQTGNGQNEAPALLELDDIAAAVPRKRQEDEATKGFSLIFLDHDKDAYRPDLARLLELGAVPAGSVVVADNVIFPGAPGFLDFVGNSKQWRTRIEKMPFERKGYETNFEEVGDGMSISRRIF